jgi:hypothetical protein
VFVPLGNPTVVTMGMGQEDLIEPAIGLAGTVEYFRIIEAVREALRGDSAEPVFDDGINVYKIAAMLHQVNQSPLANPLFNKITRLVFEKKIKIKADLESKISKKSNPFKIVIGEHRVIRETDE